jgi:glycosyltransferase involved in cell wall biosynthesis
MRVLNLMWGFSLGGVGKCFLTYARLGEVDPRLDIRTVCINLGRVDCDLSPLEAVSAEMIAIHGRGDCSWIRRCGEWIRRIQPDVIFTHNFNGPVVVNILRRVHGFKIPMLCSYHSEYHPPKTNRKLLAPLLNAVAHHHFRRHAAGIVTVADCNKAFLIQQGVPEGRITVVHNGLPLRDLPAASGRAGLSPDVFSIGIASRLDPIKGLNYLVEAVALLRGQGIPVHLELVGDGPLAGSLRRQVSALHLDEQVRFTGYLPDVESRLASWDVFVLPSLSEAHSLSLLEAMRAGKAILATNVGGNPESVRNGVEAVLVPPADAGALAKGLEALALNRPLRDRLAAGARRRFETNFTDAAMKRGLADWLLRYEPALKV